MTVLQLIAAALIRLASALTLSAALIPQPAPLHAASYSSIPDEGLTIVVDDRAVAALPAVTLMSMEEGSSASIPLEQLGVEVQKQYEGDGLSIVATQEGVVLHSVFQDLAGLVTENGLQLRSTSDDAQGLPSSITATALGRGMARRTLAYALS